MSSDSEADPQDSKAIASSATSEIDRCLIGRRTISRFQEKEVAKHHLEQAIQIARWAPNHHLTEPWHFYVLGPTAIKSTVDLIYTLTAETKSEEMAGRKSRRAANVPAWVVVTSRRSEDPILQQEDYAATSCAIHNFSLHLWQQGIGMKWCTSALVEDERFYSVVGVKPSEVIIVGALRIGYPITMPTQKRLDPKDITTWLA